MGRCGRVWVGATTQQATACKEEKRPQTWLRRLNRVRSAVTQKVNAVVAQKVSVHAALPADASGQLRFLGLYRRAAGRRGHTAANRGLGHAAGLGCALSEGGARRRLIGWPKAGCPPSQLATPAKAATRSAIRCRRRRVASWHLTCFRVASESFAVPMRQQASTRPSSGLGVRA